MIGTPLSAFGGACLCGDVHWTASGSPQLQFNCYCIDCRKSTGAAFVPIMFFKAEHVEITGRLTRFTSPGGSGHAMHRDFCARCGSQVAAELALKPGWISIRAGTLGDINLFAPKASIFASQASDWSPPRDDLPCFEQLPSSGRPSASR